jgi:hypothetical protein
LFEKGEEMKKYLVVLLMSLMFMVACSSGTMIENGGGKTTVWIERDVKGVDPEISISADDAVLDYEHRTVTVTGVKNIMGNGGYVVPSMDFKDDKMCISLPRDTTYYIKIGIQEHTLPIIVSGKKD